MSGYCCGANSVAVPARMAHCKGISGSSELNTSWVPGVASFQMPWRQTTVGVETRCIRLRKACGATGLTPGMQRPSDWVRDADSPPFTHSTRFQLAQGRPFTNHLSLPRLAQA